MLPAKFFSTRNYLHVPQIFRPKIEFLEDRRVPGSLLVGGTIGNENLQDFAANYSPDLWESLSNRDHRQPTYKISDLESYPASVPQRTDPGSSIAIVRHEMSSSIETQMDEAKEHSVHTLGWTGVFPAAIRHSARPTTRLQTGNVPGNGGTIQGIAGTWYTLQPMPSMRQELATAAFQREIFTIGGYDQNGNSTNTVEIYNPQTDQWRSAAPLPIVNNHGAAAVANGTLYAFGGLSNRVFAYDPKADSWNDVAPMRFDHGNTPAVAVINDQIYVAGGSGPGMQETELEVYDPVADSWTTLSSMSIPRNHTAGGVIDGLFYVAAGRDTDKSGSAFEFYNPQKDQWTQLDPLPTARSGIGAGVVNNCLYVFGGEIPRLFGEVEAYCPADGFWRQLPPMQTPRHGLFASVIDNAIYLPGGATQQGFGATNLNEAYVIG